MAYTTYGLYAVKAAGLGALELVLVGSMLELSVVLAEVPTGIVADVYSRRLSVILGFWIIGIGFCLMGAMPAFWCIAVGSVLWAVGGTFISGAHQAWLADEIGESAAAPIYLRGTQFGQIGSLVGIPFGVALASRQLQLPMLVAGVGCWVLAALLSFTMSELGFSPGSRVHGNPWQGMLATLRDGIETVRGRSELVSILIIMLVYGMSGESHGTRYSSGCSWRYGSVGTFTTIDSSCETHFQPWWTPAGTRTSIGLRSPMKYSPMRPCEGEPSRPSYRTSLTIPFTQQKLSSCTLCRCQALTTPG